jgi:hypothetical protein
MGLMARTHHDRQLVRLEYLVRSALDDFFTADVDSATMFPDDSDLAVLLAKDPLLTRVISEEPPF